MPARRRVAPWSGQGFAPREERGHGSCQIEPVNKPLGFLLLCLVCSGAVAVALIRGQMTHLAYEQMRVLFERDVRNIRAFLQGKATWLLAVTRDLAKIEQFAHEVQQGVEQVRAVWP